MDEGDGNENADEMDANFDFGRAKMDYFKQRAKDILMGETDLEYEGSAMQLNMCFKNLKNAIRNPVVVHAGAENQPNYLKMTFSTARAAVNGDRFLEMSKLIGSNGSLRPDAVIGGSQSTLGTVSKIPALMRAGKEMQEESLMMLSSMFVTGKKKSKKEEMIDKKIEYLLETYKKQDEELLKKAGDKSARRKADRKKLRDKFGFSDDEDEDEAGDNMGDETSTKSDAKLHTQKSKDLGNNY